MRTLSLLSIALGAAAAAAATAACGGADAPVAADAAGTDRHRSDEAIAVVRRSFDAMGGIERLRLAGARVRIAGTASVDGADSPVAIHLGGPKRFRLDYVGEQISYVYADGECRKVVYDVSVPCVEEETRWIVPVRILVGLTFPAADAAQLGATFRLLEDAEGGARSVVEVRPLGTNLKIRAAYDKATGLLAEAKFEIKDAAGGKTAWTVGYGDWREEKKMQVPHARTVSLGGEEIWRDTATTVDFGGYDAHAFDPPLPPTVDEPIASSLPARRFVRSDVGGIAVEIPAPPATPGGAWLPEKEVAGAAATEVMRIVHKGPVKDAAQFVEKLKGGASSAGKKPVGEPGIILLERPAAPGDPVLTMLYLAVVPEEIQVKVTP